METILTFRKKRTFGYQNILTITPRMKKLTKLFLTTLLLTASGACVLAQPNSSGLWEEVTDTPIDAGIAFMAIAGIGYGLKQLKNRKK
jgi:hypothetical protein